MKANNLQGFEFTKIGAGHYRVIYTTRRGDFWRATVTDMAAIDATLHADWAKLSDIKHLRDIVKRNGNHYHSNGEKFSY